MHLTIRVLVFTATLLFLPLAAPAQKQALSPDFINFGYLQNNAVLPYLHYEALTHIAPPFVNFDGNGNLTNPDTFLNRSSYLKDGGAADRAGTKVILCVRNSAFNEVILRDVMQSATRRTTLVNEVKDLVLAGGYCAGVNFDFEFSWTTSTRDGITAFIQQMRTALPDHEISVYTHAIYNPDRWNIPGIVNSIDYMLYSTYDWGSGMTPHAIDDFNNCVPHIANYLDAGLPPEKMVLTWAAYGRRWYDTNAYNQLATTDDLSQGFYNILYDTTIRKSNGGPFTQHYVRGDEIAWHTFTNNGHTYTSVGNTPESLEYKIASALNFPGDNGRQGGVRLGGVGWWSLMWAANCAEGDNLFFFDAFDPVTNSIVARPHYYRHIDHLVQELLKPPGQTKFPLESFENGNNHWRDPDQSPDSTGSASYARVSAPGGPGRPEGTSNAGRLNFSFAASSGNKTFLRFELLNNRIETNVTDTNATLGPVSKNTRISGSYYVAGNYSTRNLRLALVDSNRQIEVSDPIPLPATAGWRTFTWDFNDPENINAWTTTEPAFVSGNGVVDSKSPGAEDISFLGFIVEGGTAGSGSIYFDELTYEDHAPDGAAYVINEFRYFDDSKEFVEIAGPPGPFPPDMRLVAYNSADGSVHKQVTLSGKSIPANGLYVVGDAGVAGASGATGHVPAGWSTATNDLPNQSPGALQLYGATSGHVYDSAVYAAFGGVADLARVQTRRVTREGYGWMSNVGRGLATNGEPYTMGRMADGVDTNINQDDFSFMPPTPGQPNGASGQVDLLHDFESLPPDAFQTYQHIRLTDPSSAELPASPGGGKAYRCVDTTGGGVVGVFGDALTGAARGIDVTGQLYIPATAHASQAVAIGFCGTQGTTFFSNTPGGSGYENGYWLIYENGIVNLTDGQPNHPGQFQLVMASNDNQDAAPTTAIGAKKSLSQVSATNDSWVTFQLKIDPLADAGEQLIVQVNAVDIYRGPIPENGRTHGAIMVGHREVDGVNDEKKGTWVDNLMISYSNPPARVEDYHLY